MSDIDPTLDKVFKAIQNYQDECWKNVRRDWQWRIVAADLVTELEDIYHEYYKSKQHEQHKQ